MASFPSLFSDLYTVAKFFLKLFLLRLAVLLRPSSAANPFSTTHHFQTLVDSVDQEYPATHYYSSADERRSSAEECAVCLHDFVKGEAVRKLGCGHTFHKGCVDRWFQELGNKKTGDKTVILATCPLCRSGVLPLPAAAGECCRRREGDVGTTTGGGGDRLEWGQRQLALLLASLRGDSTHEISTL